MNGEQAAAVPKRRADSPQHSRDNSILSMGMVVLQRGTSAEPVPKLSKISTSDVLKRWPTLAHV